MSDKILVNGRFLTPKINGGVKRFAINVLRELNKLAPGKYVLLCPVDADLSLIDYEIEYKYIGKMLDNKWEQISLPLFMKTHSGRLLNLCNISPYFYNDYVVIHDVAWGEHDLNSSWSVKEGSWARRMDKFTARAVKKCRKIFTVSEFSKSRIVALYGADPDKVIVIHAGCDHCRNIISAKTCEHVMYLCVSNVAGNKNFTYMQRLADELPDIEIYAIGKCISGNNVAEGKTKLHYLGELSDEEIAGYYKNCDAYVSPSLYEGFGLTPMEALYFGCRRLYLSDIPVFHEIYGDVANFFDPYDIRSFVSACKLAKDADESAVKALLEKYTWANTAKKLHESICR